MVGLITSTGIFLYENKENAIKKGQIGMSGWLFWNDDTKNIIKQLDIELLLEKSENKVVECDKSDFDFIYQELLKR